MWSINSLEFKDVLGFEWTVTRNILNTVIDCYKMKDKFIFFFWNIQHCKIIFIYHYGDGNNLLLN